MYENVLGANFYIEEIFVGEYKYAYRIYFRILSLFSRDKHTHCIYFFF